MINHFEQLKNKNVDKYKRILPVYSKIKGMTAVKIFEQAGLSVEVLGKTRITAALKSFKKEFNFKEQFLHSYQLKFNDLDKNYQNLSNKTFEAPLNEEYEALLEKIL